jgi:hypothetical protein
LSLASSDEGTSIEMPTLNELKFCIPMGLALGVVAAMLAAPTASAVPECTYTGPSTTQCEGPSSAQINTAPNPALAYNYGWGWPWWGSGISIGIGRFGR